MKTMKTMKTTNYIFIAIFTLHTTFLTAGNILTSSHKFADFTPKPFTLIMNLTPSAPDVIMDVDTDGLETITPLAMAVVKSLVPETPNEVALEEYEPVLQVDLKMLTPEIPNVVGLEETESDNPVSLVELAPAFSTMPSSL